MKEKSQSNYGAPLIEIVISIAVFAICAIIIASLFLGSHYIQRKSSDLVKANLKAQTEAELIVGNSRNYMSDDGFSVIEKHQNYMTIEKMFDDEWNPTNKDTAEYLMSIKIEYNETDNGVMTMGSVKIVKQRPYPFLNNSDLTLVSYNVKGYSHE